jgi:glycine cleavage system H protein
VEIQGYKFPEDLKYDKKHFWEKIEGDTITMGMTDFTVRLAGEFVYVEVIEPGRRVKKGEVLMSVESGKWVGRVYAPADGEVVAFNENLEFEPEKINEDPYGDGWLVRIRVTDQNQLEELMTVDDLEPWLTPEIERVRGEKAQ